MNFSIYFVLLVSTAVPYAAQGETVQHIFPNSRFLEDIVNRTFNTIIEEQVKPLDPLHLDKIETDALGNKILAEDITVEGFSNAYFSHIKVSGFFSPKLVGTILLSKVTSNVSHLEVELDDGTIAHGSANILLEDLRFHITADVNVAKHTLSNVKVQPHLERGEVTVTGNDDEKVIQEITELLEYFLNYTLNNDIDLHEQLSIIIQEIINSQ